MAGGQGRALGSGSIPDARFSYTQYIVDNVDNSPKYCDVARLSRIFE